MYPAPKAGAARANIFVGKCFAWAESPLYTPKGTKLTGDILYKQDQRRGYNVWAASSCTLTGPNKQRAFEPSILFS